MCTAIRFDKLEFSKKQLKAVGLDWETDEIKLSFKDNNSLLPVNYNGRNLLLPWGNRGEVGGLPKTGFCRMESLKQGKWGWFSPQKAVILASSALTNGTWYQIRQGIEAVVVESSDWQLFCYLVTQPATHYFKIMTGADRMPLLVNQIL